jgi:hypothetical protein
MAPMGTQNPPGRMMPAGVVVRVLKRLLRALKNGFLWPASEGFTNEINHLQVYTSYKVNK